MAYNPTKHGKAMHSPHSSKREIEPLGSRPFVAAGYLLTGLCNLFGIKTEAQRRIDADLATHRTEMTGLMESVDDTRRAVKAADAVLASTMPFGKKTMTSDGFRDITGAPAPALAALE